MELLHPIQIDTNYEQGSHWIVTSNHGYIAYAQEEWRRRFGQLKSRMLVSGEIALMELPVDRSEVFHVMESEPAIFIRYLQPVDLAVDVQALQSDQEHTLDCLLDQLMKSVDGSITNLRVGVHVRSSTAGESLDKELRDALRSAVERKGASVAIQDPERIVALFIHDGAVYAGLMTPEQAGSDWTGGTIRFRREEGQVSRAKFKLLEAERTFGLDFAAYRNALDIGAAPGGWTSLLLERGIQVTAVDPAAMHPSLIEHPNLTYYKSNAGDVALEPGEFDLLVCDMSWSPKVTAQLVIGLLDSVVQGGTVIVTVKLMHKKPLQTIREVKEMFMEHLHIIRAKQLFHNRDEITLYMMKM
ncbi:SAM-dependent methyltransferase [Paenibacillus alvei]|uniref:SAM-dependent methyltransferase n=1 Tax=Paenibacillus alvei TaxID=44250 RepID=UPI00028951BD|nr:SAM-dependent methyltransferase [Paenibacillus alvei]EJW15693.1 ribosomal RNA large subunit methyltransferase J [Paenibacillus alvei DSM 29]MCY9543788.1 SAM-dependent methyltransferase [Paenibacillus alvei]MCY9707485.1 SAM-dependent methyltransferase [Paenibacillus alvei]MCY9734113.1 SAM-dependent methyltransferase [Paenibacillus alvei]MCY9756290.1 SAM-dependent methyltransferase [Paenibacillus alvei]